MPIEVKVQQDKSKYLNELEPGDTFLFPAKCPDSLIPEDNLYMLCENGKAFKMENGFPSKEKTFSLQARVIPFNMNIEMKS